MIRVLQVINAPDRGGTETMIMNIYRRIDRTQIQFDFTNHKIQPGDYEAEILQMGGLIHYLPKLHINNFFKYISEWKKLLSQHSEYEIIHIHNYNLSGIVAKIARQLGRKVIITHSHSTKLGMPFIKRLGFKLLYNSMLRNSTHYFACGTNAGKFLFGNKQFTVVPNAIDTDVFKYSPEIRQQIRDSYGIPTDCKVYGHVGSFRVPKNHTFLIDIFAAIHKIEPDAKLIMVGSGDLLSEIKSKVELLGLTDHVIFAGQQQNVSNWLNAFDVFLMPSLWEGLPVSVVEAQCSGLNCVISDVIDQDVNITDTVTFVSLDDPAEVWAQIITSVPDLNREAMGEIIKNSIYNIDSSTLRISEFYLNSLAKHL